MPPKGLMSGLKSMSFSNWRIEIHYRIPRNGLLKVAILLLRKLIVEIERKNLPRSFSYYVLPDLVDFNNMASQIN
jgi:hypothetical protein